MADVTADVFECNGVSVTVEFGNFKDSAEIKIEHDHGSVAINMHYDTAKLLFEELKPYFEINPEEQP